MFSDFMLSDDCIEKNTSKYIRLYIFFIHKKNWIKKDIISSEKMRNFWSRRDLEPTSYPRPEENHKTMYVSKNGNEDLENYANSYALPSRG